jgi:hypothetical protein
MNAAMDAGVPAVFVIPGDSTTYAYAAAGAASVVNAANLSPAKNIYDRLTTLGFNVTYDCYNFGTSAYGTSHVDSYNSAMTLGAGWTTVGFANMAGNQILYSPSPVVTATTIQARLPWSRAGIFYRKFSGFGIMSLDRGGTAQTVDTSNATDALGYTEFDFPLGTDPVNIKRVSGGSVIPFAIRLWNPATPRLIIIHPLGNGGWTTSTWQGAASPCSPFNALQNIGAHAFEVKLGINDKIASVAAATFEANLTAIGNQCLGADAPGIALPPDLFFAIPNICASGASGDFDATYITAVENAATATGTRAPVNLRTLTVTRTDSSHPNAAGYATIGVYEADQMYSG